jgi:hypothetical protein
MIAPEWKRIAGLHVLDDGNIGVVWMALDTDTDTIHLYDCCLFRSEVLAVISEGINARGRWVPISWEKGAKDMSEKLLERGCNMLPEPISDTDALREVASRDIWERLRTKRLKADKRLSEWIDEYKSYYRDGSKVPNGSFPLMAATRHAVGNLNYAKRQAPKRSTQNYPKLAII